MELTRRQKNIIRNMMFKLKVYGSKYAPRITLQEIDDLRELGFIIQGESASGADPSDGRVYYCQSCSDELTKTFERAGNHMTEQESEARLNKLESLPRWVIGIVDSHGAIHARESDGSTHSIAEKLAGRPWRFNTWSQEFYPTVIGFTLEPDEVIAVTDWLERNGYIVD